MALTLYRSCYPDTLLLPTGFWSGELAYIAEHLFPPRSFPGRTIYQARLDPKADLVHCEEPACEPVIKRLKESGIQVASFDAWDWLCLEYVVFDPSCLLDVKPTAING